MKSKGKSLIVANWKANPDTEKEAKRIFASIKKSAQKYKNIDMVVCPSLIHMSTLKTLVRSGNIKLGSQDFFYEPNGSFTGFVGYEALLEEKIKYAIIGHSERRALGEDNAMIAKKLNAAIATGITPILCIGENKRDESLNYLNFIKEQLFEAFSKIPKVKVTQVVIAYEPVWAIGKRAARSASPAEIKEIVIFIKRVIGDIYKTKSVPPIKIIYGASVDAKNAGEILDESGVDGLLVGRASLDTKLFPMILEKINEETSRH